MNRPLQWGRAAWAHIKMTHLGREGFRAAAGALLIASIATAQTALFEFGGGQIGGSLGRAVSGAGDVNGDGFDDLIVGAPTTFSSTSNAGLVRVFSGTTGALLYEIQGENAFDFLGCAVSGAGDINKDGFDDFIVGIRGDDTNGLNAGAVAVYSGIDGSKMLEFFGDQTGDAFGSSVAHAGDVDKDNYEDFIVGMPNSDRFAFDGGAARIISGRNGFVMFTFYGLEDGEHVGTAVAAAGDVNRDGYDDVLISAIDFLVGHASVVSGKNGKRLIQMDGDPLGDGLGRSLATVGDTDGDGFDDFLIGAPFSSLSAPGAGAAYLYSGVDGGLIRFFTGEASGDMMGYSVAGTGDANNDGFADYAIGVPGRDFSTPDASQPNLALGFEVGEINVYSGKTGSLLYSVRGKNAGDLFGWSMAIAGDTNRDGHTDFIVGSVLGDKSHSDSGTVRVLSSAKLGLTMDRHEISLSLGGTQTLTASTEPQHAGLMYWFIGGASGTFPGFPTGTGTLPLNFDNYTQYSIAHPFGKTLSSAQGILDSNGEATCLFVIAPQSDPSLSGLTLHHAFGLIDPITKSVIFHSNAVPISLND